MQNEKAHARERELMRVYAERMHPNSSPLLVEKAIEETMRFDDGFRNVLQLFLRGSDSDQMAEALEITASTARDRLARAREMIRERIKEST